jgi:hypothetical protein
VLEPDAGPGGPRLAAAGIIHTSWLDSRNANRASRPVGDNLNDNAPMASLQARLPGAGIDLPGAVAGDFTAHNKTLRAADIRE